VEKARKKTASASGYARRLAQVSWPRSLAQSPHLLSPKLQNLSSAQAWLMSCPFSGGGGVISIRKVAPGPGGFGAGVRLAEVTVARARGDLRAVAAG
jgi:hypothetical protein